MSSSDLRDVHWKVKDFYPRLDSSNNGQMVELYSPGIYKGIPLDGYLIDCIINIDLPSIEKLPRIDTYSALMTQEEKDSAWYEATKSHPAKQINFYASNADFPNPNHLFSVACFRQDPCYQESLLPSFTSNRFRSIPYGTTIYAQSADYNSGLLGTGDIVTFQLVVSEEVSLALNESSVSGIPTTKTVTNTSTVVLPANVNRRGATFVNRGSEPIYLARGNSAIAGAGLTLLPNTPGFEINRSNYYAGAVCAIVSTGTGILDIEEME